MYLVQGKIHPNAVILAPQSPNGWTSGWEDLMELIEFIVQEYNIDRTRISVTGSSRGGVCTFELIMRYPDYFASAMPINSSTYTNNCNKIKTPVRIYHGGQDYGMGFAVVAANDIINSNGGQSELIMFDWVGHGCQFIYYQEKYDVYNWLTSHVNENNTPFVRSDT